MHCYNCRIHGDPSRVVKFNPDFWTKESMGRHPFFIIVCHDCLHDNEAEWEYGEKPFIELERRE